MKRKTGFIKKTLSFLLVMFMLIPLAVGALTYKSGAYNFISYGIDVSKWQGTIDWDAVKTSGIDFVILKAGSTKGMDEYFEFNYLAAKSRGLDVGAYFYTYAMNESEAIADAELMAGWLNGKTFEYPIYFDIEDPSQEVLSKEARTNMCIAFNSTLESKGYFTGIYASKSWLNSYLDKATLASKYTIWEASWRNSGQPDIDKSGDCQMWQYSATGTVAGINGSVDMDVCYVNYPEVIKRVGLNGFSKGSVGSTISAYYQTTAASLNVRQGPGTSYSIVTSVPKGTTVILLDVNSSGTWSKVYCNGYTGWLSNSYLTLSSPVHFEYTVNYETGLSGVTVPDSVTMGYGDVVTVSGVNGLQGYTFKGWNLKRVSDNAWYTEANGWISESSISSYEKAVFEAGETLAADGSFVRIEAGSDRYVLSAVWDKSMMLGDSNGDGTLNAKDSLLFKMYLSGNKNAVVDPMALDLNGDGSVNSKDSVILKMHLAGVHQIGSAY